MKESDHEQCQVASSRPSGQPQRRPDGGTSNAGCKAQTAGGFPNAGHLL